MKAVRGPRAYTTGSAHFEPDEFFKSWAEKSGSLLPRENDLRSSITTNFNLPQSDSYVYHAVASVTLPQVQQVIGHGGETGLHAWYRDEEGRVSKLPPPSKADIDAYTSIFASTTSTSRSLTAFSANARKASHRASVGLYLHTKRLLPTTYQVPKLKKAHVNPYYDFWAWSCQNLEWAGPTAEAAHVQQSHYILPIFMHHFGCVCPSYEALEVVKQTARGRKVLDLGSGNGYWTYMLRRLGIHVDAVDNLQSRYRSLWIDDTIVEEGEGYLKAQKGAKDSLLLLVYPIVGLEFTKRVLDAYAGDTVCVIGTQNRNGYTAFQRKIIDEYVAEEKQEYIKTVQIPLPSFAGKDEALFIFERGHDS